MATFDFIEYLKKDIDKVDFVATEEDKEFIRHILKRQENKHLMK